ncbi:MAG: alpha/beta fold hydrolase [Polyangiales bacterium]
MRAILATVLLVGCGGTVAALPPRDAGADVAEVFTVPPLPEAPDAAVSPPDVVDVITAVDAPEVATDVPAPQPERLPVVLVHGFAGFQDIGPIGYFFRVAPMLRAQGRRVYEAVLPPFGSTPQRVPALRTAVDDALRDSGAARVVIIAHSQGGLDARYLVSTLGYGDRVAAVATISTPHRGTAVADLFDSAIPGVADGVVNAFATLLGVAYNEARSRADLRAALQGMRTSAMTRFNDENPNDPRVRYYSWAGRSNRRDGRGVCDDGEVRDDPARLDNTTIFLAGIALVLEGINARENVNDGMVTVRSAKWGRFMGCVPADHFDEVGQIAQTMPVRESGFDHLAFYRSVVATLERDGF